MMVWWRAETTDGQTAGEKDARKAAWMVSQKAVLKGSPLADCLADSTGRHSLAGSAFPTAVHWDDSSAAVTDGMPAGATVEY